MVESNHTARCAERVEVALVVRDVRFLQDTFEEVARGFRGRGGQNGERNGGSRGFEDDAVFGGKSSADGSQTDIVASVSFGCASSTMAFASCSVIPSNFTKYIHAGTFPCVT